MIRCGVGPAADVHADLTAIEGRARTVSRVRDLAPAGIDGVALVAGSAEPGTAVGLNYFGALALFTALRDDLSRGPTRARWS